MSSIQLSLIGTPQITKDGKRLKIPTRKAFALLVYLAITTVPHRRESLIAFVWPELDETRGRAALRRELSRLNRALGAGWVETVGETVQILPLVEVDVYRVREQWVQSQTLAQLQTAVQRMSGEWMAGFSLPDSPAFDAWQQQQAFAWLQTRQQALRQLATQLADEGKNETAVAIARQLVNLDPFDEANQRLLMTILVKAGQRVAALQQYESLATLLQVELRTEPSPGNGRLGAANSQCKKYGSTSLCKIRGYKD